MQTVAESSEDEMVACSMLGEFDSPRFGPALREALAAAGRSMSLLRSPDLDDPKDNAARRRLLVVTRGYGQHRDVFDASCPADLPWSWAVLTSSELAEVADDYWAELSGGTRRPVDAARRIRAGTRAFDVPNQRFEDAARALARGHEFPPLILAGATEGSLVCLEGNLRLTAHALCDFPDDVTCLVGVTHELNAWVTGPTADPPAGA